MQDHLEDVGMKLAEFSHWPIGWHKIVVPVLREARFLGTERLYVKEKLGGLRIQGGGPLLAESVAIGVDLATSTCANCGSSCERATPPTLPLCGSCGFKTDPLALIFWVEPE